MKTVKKLFALTLTFLLAASLGTLGASAATDITFDFEEGVEEWAKSGNDTVISHITDTALTHNGSAGAMAVTTGQALTTVTLEENETYLVSAFLYIPGTVENAVAFSARNYRYSSSTPVSGEKINISVTKYTTTDSAWKYICFQLSTGVDTDWTIYFDAKNETEVYIDDIVLEKMDSLLLNGDFERTETVDTTVSAIGWAGYDGGASFGNGFDIVSGAEARSGNALKIYTNKGGQNGRISQKVTGLEENTWYELSAFGRKGGTITGGAPYMLVFDSESGLSNSATNTNRLGAITFGDSAWTRKTILFKTVDTDVAVQFSGQSNLSADNYGLVDDVYLKKLGNDIEITDANGNKTATVSSGTYSINFTLLSSDTTKALSKTCIVARYKKAGDAKQLDAVIADTITVDAITEEATELTAPCAKKSLSIEVPADGEYEVKAFMVDLPSMQNACKAASAVTDGYNS